MKRNSFLAILVLVLLLTVALFAACNDKKVEEHSFSEEWSADETHHWHACADIGMQCSQRQSRALLEQRQRDG